MGGGDRDGVLMVVMMWVMVVMVMVLCGWWCGVDSWSTLYSNRGPTIAWERLYSVVAYSVGEDGV